MATTSMADLLRQITEKQEQERLRYNTYMKEYMREYAKQRYQKKREEKLASGWIPKKTGRPRKIKIEIENAENPEKGI